MERYLKLQGLQNEPSLMELSKKFCKFAAQESQLGLTFSQSVIAAAAVTLALTVSTSRQISNKIGCKHLGHLQAPQKPCDWWTNDVVRLTNADLGLTRKCYLILVELNDLSVVLSFESD